MPGCGVLVARDAPVPLEMPTLDARAESSLVVIDPNRDREVLPIVRVAFFPVPGATYVDDLDLYRRSRDTKGPVAGERVRAFLCVHVANAFAPVVELYK